MKKLIFTSSTLLITAAGVFFSCAKQDNTTPAPANPYGSGNGNVSFWTSNNVPNGIDVIVNSTTVHMGQYFPSGTPTCAQQGTASFTLPAGTYNYTAQQTGGGSTWGGSVTVANGGCLTEQLTGGGGSTTGGSTTGGSTTGSSTTGGSTTGGSTTGGTTTNYALFYTNNGTYGNINIYINNQYQGTLSGYYTSGQPTCSSYNDAVRVAISGTNNTWYAQTTSGTTRWPASGSSSIPISGCSPILLQ
jgi:hypothetical protein